MKKSFLYLFCLILLSFISFSQPPSCPNNSIYIHNGSSVSQQAVSPPGGPASVILTGLPGGASGLAVGPPFAFPAPNPTWWVTSGGTYWYYNNGGTWTNTGHTAGGVNIGGGGGFLFNIVGGSGQIWRYNGTGNAVLILTIATFGGGGPYDLVVDAAGNFYVLKLNGPQNLTVYNSNGVQLCSYNLANAPISSAGGGFAIVNNTVYYSSSSSQAGNIIPGNSTITFTPQALAGGGDWANCTLPVPTSTILAPQGGTLTCTLPSIQLVAQISPNGAVGMASVAPSSTLNVCTYTWSGPGIIAGQFTPTITVNQPGVYSYTTCTGSCPSYSLNNSYTVVGQPSVLNPTITAPTCMSGNAILSVLPNTATNTILWSGPGITSGQGTATININSPGLYSVSISSPSSACAGSATVNVNASPTLAIAYTSPTMCAQNYNNSLNSITLTPSGASNYTLLMTSNYTTATPNGPTMVLMPVPPFANATAVASNTLIGSNGVCSATITSVFSIIPNPTITVTSASVCAGLGTNLVASGATDYNWSPSLGLNTTNGATVIANPNTTSVYSVIGTSLGCNSTTETSTLLVVPNPTISVTPLTNTICVGGNINITAAGASTYDWAPNTGLNTTTGAVVNASPNSTTDYTVVGSQNSCTAQAVYQVSVIIVPNLLTSVSKDIICRGGTSNFNVNGASGYNWSPTAGLSSPVGAFVVASPAVSTIYTVTGFNGVCTASATIPIEVVPLPNLSISSPEYQICYGKSTPIFASGAQNYTWSPATGLSSTTNSNVIAAPLSNVNYTVVGYNQSGTVVCPQQMSYSIIVVPIAVPAISNSIAICEGAKTMLIASGANTIIWTPTVGLNAGTGGAVIASPSVSTLYEVDISHDGFCGASTSVYVQVNPNPTVKAGRDTIINLDQPMFLSATGTGTMTWIDGDAIICRDCPNSQVMATRNSCYVIQTVNEFGCKATDDMCIEVTTEYGVYIPNAFTPNGDGINDEFLIKGYNITDITMDIFDRWGEKLFSSKELANGWKGTFKNADCEQGVYIYKITYKGLDG
ncbi:MAG: gliding motility-associated C-terminal domain-containing protein, partial [Bacteroidota bacterium]|nr:gliding motility-associated C-terminal domain-containing protein [Bacteroidota bacterium]